PFSIPRIYRPVQSSVNSILRMLLVLKWFVSQARTTNIHMCLHLNFGFAKMTIPILPPFFPLFWMKAINSSPQTKNVALMFLGSKDCLISLFFNFLFHFLLHPRNFMRICQINEASRFPYTCLSTYHNLHCESSILHYGMNLSFRTND